MKFRGQLLSPNNVRLLPRTITRSNNIRPAQLRSLNTDSSEQTNSHPAPPQTPFKTDIRSFFETLNKQQNPHINVQSTSSSNTNQEQTKSVYVSILDTLPDGAQPSEHIKADRINQLIETTPIEYLLRLPLSETPEALENRWKAGDYSVVAYPPKPLVFSGEIYQLDKKGVIDYVILIRHQVTRKFCLDSYKQGKFIKLLSSNIGQQNKIERLYYEEMAYLQHLSYLYSISHNSKVSDYVLETLPLMVDLMKFYGISQVKAQKIEHALIVAKEDFASVQNIDLSSKAPQH